MPPVIPPRLWCFQLAVLEGSFFSAGGWIPGEIAFSHRCTYKSKALLSAHQKSGLDNSTPTLQVKLQEGPALWALPSGLALRGPALSWGSLSLMSIAGWG